MTEAQKARPDDYITSAFQTYAKRLGSYAYSRVHDLETSQDLVQDTFMKTWVYLTKRGKIHLMKAFLYRVLNNLIVDTYRRNKTTSLDILFEKGFEPWEDPSERLINILDGSRVRSLLPQLPEKYRAVIMMHYVDGLSLSEISRRTGTPKNTIAVQLHRGLHLLKHMYDMD